MTPLLKVSSLTIATAIAFFSLGNVSAAALQGEKGESEKIKTSTLNKVQVKADVPRQHEVNAGALGKLSELDTPFSVKTVTSDQIQDAQAYTLSQVFSQDASVSRSGSDYNGWSSRMIVRGLPLSFTDSTKIDGIPFALFGVNPPLSAMESVQLLKGSSAFMYGFGSPGGIISYQLKQAPDSGTLSSVDMGYRSDNIFSEHVDFGTRLGRDERYGLRINAEHMAGTSYAGTSVHNNSLALAFDARLTDSVTLALNVLYERSTLAGQAPYLYPTSDYDSKWLPKVISGYTKAGSRNSYNRNKFLFLDADLNWKISDNWSAKLTAAHSSNHFKLAQEYFYISSHDGDYDNTTFDGVDLWSFKYLQAMVNGHFDTGPIGHDVVLGISYEDDYEKLGTRNFNGQYGTVLSSNLYSFVRAIWQPVGGADDFMPYSETIQHALFASDTLSYGDKWKAILGVRYTNFNQRTWDTDTFSTTTAYRQYPITPTVALIYKPTAGSTVYASYVQALEAGSTVGSQYANYGETLKPIKSRQYEAGYKWNGYKFDVSAALFRIDRGAEYADESTNEYVSNGKMRYQGIDASVEWRVNPNLKLGLSGVYLDDANYKKTDAEWLVGQRVEATAHASGSFHVDYDLQAIPGLSFGGNARYVGATRVYNFSSSELAIDAKAYTLFDASASYRTVWGGKNVTFRAGMNNIFNRDYWVGGSYSFWLGAPREYMLNVKVDLL